MLNNFEIDLKDTNYPINLFPFPDGVREAECDRVEMENAFGLRLFFFPLHALCPATNNFFPGGGGWRGVVSCFYGLT